MLSFIVFVNIWKRDSVAMFVSYVLLNYLNLRTGFCRCNRNLQTSYPITSQVSRSPLHPHTQSICQILCADNVPQNGQLWGKEKGFGKILPGPSRCSQRRCHPKHIRQHSSWWTSWSIAAFDNLRPAKRYQWRLVMSPGPQNWRMCRSGSEVAATQCRWGDGRRGRQSNEDGVILVTVIVCHCNKL